ncbi:MAG: ChaN family lipoprotein [Gemmatimonadales bacterium]|nr:ChaN family lipoprotein [Gemmatimonadales bacterium]
MPRLLALPLLTGLALAACAAGTRPQVATPTSDAVTIVDAPSGRPLTRAQLRQRLASAPFVLLGELHDNAIHHRVRGELLAEATPKPAVVFEQFSWRTAPLGQPEAGAALDTWLDAGGFDRAGWRWPLHEPVVRAALALGTPLRGSNLGRDTLRPVVRDGISAAPPRLRALVARAPLDSAANAAIVGELVTGHCGMLPPAMVPGMRAAQEARDAAMTDALLAARAEGGGRAWLIAGNGHVRRDMGVPRMLRVMAPEARVLSVGFLERGPDGAAPEAADRRGYDVVVITARAEREDPCASLRQQMGPPRTARPS